jgi:hypothetical protein
LWLGQGGFAAISGRFAAAEITKIKKKPDGL